MPRFIAFLRAIHVGGHTIKMDALRQHFESLGFSNVETFIASGNVIFESPSKNIPFRPLDLAAAAALNIAFLKESLADASVKKLLSLQTDIENFHVHGREVYWRCRKKQSESTFSNAVLEKALGIKSTLRGVNTIQKMAAKYGKTG
jgi:uncharacterized protein (DUF1697 family)